MDDPNRWRQMASAPKDGRRILVTIRPSKQGPAEVDLAYWSNGDQFGPKVGAPLIRHPAVSSNMPSRN
jgi:hypothetical protein